MSVETTGLVIAETCDDRLVRSCGRNELKAVCAIVLSRKYVFGSINRITILQLRGLSEIGQALTQYCIMVADVVGEDIGEGVDGAGRIAHCACAVPGGFGQVSDQQNICTPECFE